MEQNEINIEKQELMERIKEVYENANWPKNKWLRIAESIIIAFLPFVILFDEITEGAFGLKQSIYLAFCILYAILLIAVDYRRLFWNKRVQQAETAHDLLQSTTGDYFGISGFSKPRPLTICLKLPIETLERIGWVLVC